MSETPAIPASPSHVIEATEETFAREVIERSSTLPVVVDFWAPWCGPCRLLSPVLEKLAGEYAGKFLLAKVNIDENPNLASQFGVRSIPAVFGVRDGAVVDAFMGVQPESVIRTWINRLLPTEAEAAGRGRAPSGEHRPACRRGEIQPGAWPFRAICLKLRLA